MFNWYDIITTWCAFISFVLVEISPLQWQICTQLFSRGLFHQWIIRVLLITVSLFLIGQTAVVTYMRYTQRYVFTQRVRNSNLSFMLLISWCSLSPLTVLDSQVVVPANFNHTAFGITFVLCISCFLGKTLVCVNGLQGYNSRQ